MGETGSSGALSEGFAWDLVSLTTPCPCSRSVESSHELKTYLQFSCGPSKKKKKGGNSVKSCVLQESRMCSKELMIPAERISLHTAHTELSSRR